MPRATAAMRAKTTALCDNAWAQDAWQLANGRQDVPFGMLGQGEAGAAVTGRPVAAGCCARTSTRVHVNGQ